MLAVDSQAISHGKNLGNISLYSGSQNEFPLPDSSLPVESFKRPLIIGSAIFPDSDDSEQFVTPLKSKIPHLQHTQRDPIYSQSSQQNQPSQSSQQASQSESDEPPQFELEDLADDINVDQVISASPKSRHLPDWEGVIDQPSIKEVEGIDDTQLVQTQGQMYSDTQLVQQDTQLLNQSDKQLLQQSDLYTDTQLDKEPGLVSLTVAVDTFPITPSQPNSQLGFNPDLVEPIIPVLSSIPESSNSQNNNHGDVIIRSSNEDSTNDAQDVQESSSQHSVIQDSPREDGIESLSQNVVTQVQVLSTPVPQRPKPGARAMTGDLGHPHWISPSPADAFIPETPLIPPRLQKRKRVMSIAEDIIEAPEPGLWISWQDGKVFAGVSLRSESRNNNNLARLEVIFGDGTKGEVDPKKTFELDLKLKDRVRIVDDKKRNYEVVGFDTETSSLSNPEIYTTEGYNRVHLMKKTKNQVSTEAPVVVPVSQLYFAPFLWAAYLKDRKQLRNTITSTADTHTNRRSSRKRTIYDNESGEEEEIRVDSRYQPQNKQEEQCPRNLFEGWLFTLSSVMDEDIEARIEYFGGHVLEHGLRELFDVSDNQLQLNNQYHNFRFACVLAPQPLSTTKYLEALGLGWPCLSTRYVFDCINTGKILDHWHKYMLAAGDSKVLGCTCSFDVGNFKHLWAQGSDLNQQFLQREMILEDQMVQVVGSSSKIGSVKQSYQLFVMMMGATVINKQPAQNEGFVIINEDRSIEWDSKQLWWKRSGNTYGRDWVKQCLINRRIV